MRTRIAEFDVQQPRPVWGLEGYESARILIRSGGYPLGWVTCSVGQALSALNSETILEAIQDQLDGVDFSMPPELTVRPPISVIVCTRNRPLALKSCLASLKRLDYPELEIVVVDNASKSPETEEVASAAGCRLVRENRPGLDNARNCGARAAAYEIVAFTDDDVRVDSKWLDGVARGFAEPNVSCVTGLICPFELETPAQHLFEQYGGMGKGFRPRIFDGARMSPYELLAAHSVGVGANMAFRRSVLEAIGGFDPDLDVGTPSAGGGDLDIFHRLLAAGHRIRYEPDALVWHQHRRAISGLHKQIYSNGRAFGCYLLKIAGAGTLGAPQVAGFALHYWIGGWLLKSFFRRTPGRNVALAAAESWGAVHSPWAYLATYRKWPWK